MNDWITYYVWFLMIGWPINSIIYYRVNRLDIASSLIAAWIMVMPLFAKILGWF